VPVSTRESSGEKAFCAEIGFGYAKYPNLTIE